MQIYKNANADPGIHEYTLWEYKNALELIAGQAINLSEPETIEQARDNLLGLARLVLSACAGKGIEVT